jgi:phospholipid/cholesterol/gamma-HCH transport system permease protein
MTPATVSPADVEPIAPRLALEHTPPDTLTIRLGGSWCMEAALPSAEPLERALAVSPVRTVAFDTGEVTAWDSGLVAFALRIVRHASERGVAVERAGLPEGVKRLLALAEAVPERRTREASAGTSWLGRVGTATLAGLDAGRQMLGFLGEASVAFGRLLRGRARFRSSDLALIMQECGANALPIVTLISFLVGLILAFMGTVQLAKFGAQIYVADMVAIAAAREMAGMMTGIVMAGRTGAAFAAQLGTMKVNEEIDALVTLGISPMEFLVLPRMIALIVMMPLLTIYALVVSIAGGVFVAVALLGIDLGPYLTHTRDALTMHDIASGLFKASVFGVLVAVAGCMRGMESGRSAAAVGLAATSAVVTAIVLIIVAEGILTVIYHALGI